MDPALVTEAVHSSAKMSWVLPVIAAILLFAPLAYGGVHTWSYSIIQLTLAATLLIMVAQWEWSLLRGTTEAQINWISFPLTPFLGCFLLLAIVQLIPLPAFLVQWLSPEAAAIREIGTASPSAWYPISLNPFATRLELFRLLSYGVILFLTIWSVRSQRDLIFLILVIAAVGVFEILYGGSQLFARPARIWGWKNIYASDRLSGTFINPDHLATFLAMAFFPVFGLFLGLKPNNRKTEPEKIEKKRSLKKQLADPGFLETGAQRFLVLFLAVVLATGLILTQSRAGFGAMVVSLTAISLLNRARRQDRFPWAGVGIFVGSLACYLWLVIGGIDLSRLGSSHGKEYRLSLYYDTLTTFRDFLWTGVGLGAFADVFPKYQGTYSIDKIVEYALSDWLQLLAETGIVGFLILQVSFWSYIFYLWNQWRRRQDVFVLGVGLGYIGALLSVALHAALDFPFHVPANAVLLAVVVGLSFVTVHLHRHPWPHFRYATRLIRWPGRSSALVSLTLMAALLVYLALPVWNHWAAERLAPSERNSTRKKVEYTIENLRAAMAKSPGNSSYAVILADEFEEEIQEVQEEGADESMLRNLESEILSLYEKAVRQNPANWRHREAFGSFLVGYEGPEPREQVLRGLKELDAAVRLFPQSGYLQMVYGETLLDIEENFPDLMPDELKGTGSCELHRALEKDPDLASEVKNILERFSKSQ